MNYHPLINGVHRQKTPKNTAFANDPLSGSRNGQRHVTFRGVNQSPYKMNDSLKPKYHFTYGQSYHEGVSFVSHSKVGYNNNQFPQGNSMYKDLLESSQNRRIQQQIYQKVSQGMARERSSSNRKRKLRIFPEKFDDRLKQTIPTAKDTTKSTQFKQIAQLKGEIQRLRQQITTLTLNFSKNTSRDFSQSLYRNQADRTKRLSQLKQFNQELYHRLALKLKEISLQQYENVLQITNSNKKFLDSVYSSAGKERAYQTAGIDKPPEQNKFMDIQEFEKEYQERYSQPAGSPNKALEVERGEDREEAQSPFLIRENTIEQDGFKTIQANSASKNMEKRQAFTFHKKHAAKAQNLPKPQQKATEPAKQTHPQHRKAFDIDTQAKQKRQLHDMNRELENKIMRKRSASEYVYMARARKY